MRDNPLCPRSHEAHIEETSKQKEGKGKARKDTIPIFVFYHLRSNTVKDRIKFQYSTVTKITSELSLLYYVS